MTKSYYAKALIKKWLEFSPNEEEFDRRNRQKDTIKYVLEKSWDTATLYKECELLKQGKPIDNIMKRLIKIDLKKARNY